MNSEQIVFYNDTRFTAKLSHPDICPICNKGIVPKVISAVACYGGPDIVNVAMLYLCPSCYQAFLSVSRCLSEPYPSLRIPVETRTLYVAPQKYFREEFEPEIRTLSPQFVEIYNQAAEAEASNLDELAGIGYRKALEFLVKDFCIHKNPDSADEIKSTMLGACIKKWIDDKRINTLAERAVWIGNDETHYVRKHTDLDIKDMKRFLKALLGFIAAELAYEDAEQIQKA